MASDDNPKPEIVAEKENDSTAKALEPTNLDIGGSIREAVLNNKVQIPVGNINAYLHKNNLLGWYCAAVESQSGCSRVSVFALTLCFLSVHMLNCSEAQASYICQAICTSYPSAMSIYTMELDDRMESGVWLLYWALWGIISIAGAAHNCNIFLIIISVAFAWLWFPPTDGIHKVYHRFVRSFAQIHHGKFDKEVWENMHPIARKVVQELNEDAKTYMRKFMATEAIQALNEAQLTQIRVLQDGLDESGASSTETRQESNEGPIKLGKQTHPTAEEWKKEREKGEEQIMTTLFSKMSPEQVTQIMNIAAASKQQNK